MMNEWYNCRAYLSSHKRKMKLMKKEKREES